MSKFRLYHTRPLKQDVDPLSNAKVLLSSPNVVSRLETCSDSFFLVEHSEKGRYQRKENTNLLCFQPPTVKEKHTYLLFISILFLVRVKTILIYFYRK
jgi:hypothetical protein